MNPSSSPKKPYKCKDEDAERERRRKRYKFVLVRWREGSYAVESKHYLKLSWWVSGDDYTILCDWEPEKVLRGMLKLLKEEQ